MYRDQGDRCPRCHADLIDARSVRACEQCRGVWIAQPILEEMLLQMRTPPRHIEIPLVAHHDRPPLGCPVCDQPMEMWMLHDVDIDRCVRHGLWFDRDELERVLRGAATDVPSAPPAAQGSGPTTLGLFIDMIAAVFDAIF
jgi:Zn-finger nucleic acid-binding protein